MNLRPLINRSFVFFLFATILLGHSPFAFAAPASIELNISAASSLKDALTEIGRAFQTEHPQVRIFFNFEGSGTLQKQIEQGAPVDIFFPAGQNQMDALEKKDLLLPNSRRNLLTNEMVLIASLSSSLKTFSELNSSSIKKISIGTPQIVPAGLYAHEVLQKLGLLEKIKDKLVYGKNARTVLAHVETGNADAGIVFRTDALISNKVKIVAQAPSASHQKISYPIAIIQGTKNATQAKAFLDYLSGAKAAKVFSHYQFGFY